MSRMAHTVQDELRTCRRCGDRFSVPAASRGRLLVCPHCGASISPWIKNWKSNKNAAVLALVALAILVPGVLLPFMSIVKLGRMESYSLVGGIVQLWQDDEYFLAAIIFVFSLVFPVAKLALLLVATSSLAAISAKTRGLLHRISLHTARYSMLDVFVIAVLVVVIKIGKATEVHVRSGTALFCLAILLSVLAAACVDLA